MSKSSPIGQKGDLRIAWESKSTGYKGHGDWFGPGSREMLEDAIISAEKKFPEIRHWIETNRGMK